MATITNFRRRGDLSRAKAALAELTETDLYSLIKATYLGPRVPRSLFDWIEAACDWELDRRIGLEYPLVSPDSMIGAQEACACVQAAESLRLRYGAHSLATYRLFDAIFDLLAGDRRKGVHQEQRNRQTEN